MIYAVRIVCMQQWSFAVAVKKMIGPQMFQSKTVM